MLPESARAELEAQGRGIVGALLVLGLTFFYTMETWWIGWTFPLGHLLVYTLVGLGIVLVIARQVGFRAETGSNQGGNLAVEYGELLLQSVLAALVGLTVLGVIDPGTEPHVVIRLVMLQIVPLALGAALANQLFAGQESGAGQEAEFPGNLAVFALGATFLTAAIAPTDEMDLITAHMNWWNHLALVVLSLAIVYLALYELEFHEQEGRVLTNPAFELGTTAMAYAVAVCVAAFLLWGYGQFEGASLALVVEKTTVLGFPAAVGAAGAEVVL